MSEVAPIPTFEYTVLNLSDFRFKDPTPEGNEGFIASGSGLEAGARHTYGLLAEQLQPIEKDKLTVKLNELGAEGYQLYRTVGDVLILGRQTGFKLIELAGVSILPGKMARN